VLCPMFVNAHTHVGDTGAKDLGVGLPAEQAVNPPHGLKHRFLQSIMGTAEHVAQMRHGLQEMLHNGIGAVADFREHGVAGVRALREAAAGLPVRVLALGRMAEGASPDQLEAEAHAVLAEADGLGVRDIDAYPVDVLRRLRRAYPHKLFAAHAAEAESAERRSREQTGRGQPARLLDCQPDFLVHLVYAAPDDLRQMAAAEVAGVACPRCNGLLGSGQPRLDEWTRCGLTLALGTDNMMFNAPDMLREMDFASRLVRGQTCDAAALESREVLRAATLGGARALRLDRDLGSLAPDKEASFIAVNLNSLNLKYQQNVISALVHRATPADIAGVYVRGTRVT
jgi:cytosine/adenosine deaminase-related metal-dependent hydrolase